uniref:Uncharacterized protein n=1 Tax=Anguilla anguilla TaxID=7936 RepID=A0A0E9Q3J2_ANGAN
MVYSLLDCLSSKNAYNVSTGVCIRPL